MDLTGILRWNEFEGGFWSLDLDAPIDEIGDHVVLVGAAIPEKTVDGARIQVAGTIASDTVDFLMAGPRFEVNELRVVG